MNAVRSGFTRARQNTSSRVLCKFLFKLHGSSKKTARETASLSTARPRNYHILVVRQADSNVSGFPARLQLEIILVALHGHGHYGEAVLGFYATRRRAEAVLRRVASRVKRILHILRLKLKTHTWGWRGNSQVLSARHRFSRAERLRRLRNVLPLFESKSSDSVTDENENEVRMKVF